LLRKYNNKLVDNRPKTADNFPVATHVMTHTFFHGTSPVITPEQIAYIGEIVDEFMKLIK